MDTFDTHIGGDTSHLRFVVGDRQLKAFRTCLTGMYKIGSYLMITANGHQIGFSGCNSNRSAFVSTTLKRQFFTLYECAHHYEAVISFKNILPILKTSRVRTASFSCVPNANILIASLECDSGMMKEFRISCSEDEAFYPTIPRDIPCVEFTSEPASLSKVLSTFHSAVDIITIKSKQNETRTQEHLIELQTHVMHNEVAQDSLHTSLEFHSNIGFRSFNNTLGTPTVEVSFNIKDFSSIVHTAESLDAFLHISFSTPGEPFIAKCTVSHELEVELILATLPGDGPIQQSVSQYPYENLGSQNPYDMLLGGNTNAGDVVITSPARESQSYDNEHEAVPGFIG